MYISCFIFSLLLLCFLPVLHFLLRHESELHLVLHEQLLILNLRLHFLLHLHIVQLLLLGILYGLLYLLYLLLLLEFFLADYSSILHIIAFFNFTIPEFLNNFDFFFLLISKIRGYFIKEECAILLITISHVLLFIFMLEVLEFKVCDSAGCKIESQGRFIRLVHEIPHIDAIGFGDEYDTSTGG